MDTFIEEHISDDVKIFLSPEFNSYIFMSTTGLGKYIEALDCLSVGELLKGEGLIREGASIGDPYSIYALYKVYAADNAFGVTLSKNTAWYYIICAAVSFYTSLVYEESSLNLLNSYIEAFDNENLDKCVEIIENGVENDCTPYYLHKELLKYVLLYIMQVDAETQKTRIIEYFNTHGDFPKEFVLLYLFLVHSGDVELALSAPKNNKVKAYVTRYVKDYIVLYNQTGMLGPLGTSVGLFNSVIFAFCYLIFLGRDYEEENNGKFEEIITEIYNYCSLAINRDDSLFGDSDQLGLKYLHKLDPLVKGMMAYLYSKDYFINKNINKAHYYLFSLEDKELNNEEIYELSGLRDYLRCIGEYRILLKKENKEEEAKKSLEVIEKLYTEEIFKEKEEKEESVMPVDYYIAGFIQEKLYKNTEKAKEFYKKGIEVNNQAEDYGKIMEFLAFKRKCKTKLEKIQKNLPNK